MIVIHIILELFAFTVLCSALIHELANDAHGDNNKKMDVFVRGIICIASGTFVWIAGVYHLIYDHGLWQSILMAIAIFIMFFDYMIAYILIKNKVIVGHWFTYMGISSGVVDRYKPWSSIPPIIKLVIRAAIFFTSLAIYCHI